VAVTTIDAAPAAPAGTASRTVDSGRLFNRVCLGVLIAFAALWLLPLAWALATSFRSTVDVTTHPTAWFGHPTLESYRAVLANPDLVNWYLNSAITAGLTTLLTVLFGSMAGFALSRMRFPGRSGVFGFILAGIMISPQVLMIPQYKELAAVHLVDTYWAVVLPQVPNAIAVFVFKQFFDGLPRELLDAARADGAGWFRTYWQIFLPLCRPAVSAVSIFSFVWAWNNFLWPLLVATSTRMMTLPVGIATVQEAYGVRYAELMASAVLGGVPLLAVFLLFQRRIVEGIAGTGLK
jgi:multiple sugar transport system permease protein